MESRDQGKNLKSKLKPVLGDKVSEPQWLTTDMVTHLRDMKTHACRYIFASHFTVGKYVLDVSCGSGYGSNYIRQKGAMFVVGVDIAKAALVDAKKHYGYRGLHFVRSDAQRLPFSSKSFDVIVSIETIEHLEDYDLFLQECRRILKQDGLLVVSTPNRLAASPGSETPSWPYHIREFTVGEFRDLLYSYFNDVTVYGIFCFSGLELLKRKLEVMASTKIPLLSRRYRRFRRLASRVGLSDYTLVSLNQIKSLEDLWDDRFRPYIIPDDGRPFAMPETIIGIAKNSSFHWGRAASLYPRGFPSHKRHQQVQVTSRESFIRMGYPVAGMSIGRYGDIFSGYFCQAVLSIWDTVFTWERPSPFISATPAIILARAVYNLTLQEEWWDN